MATMRSRTGRTEGDEMLTGRTARVVARSGALLMMLTAAACGHGAPPVARPMPPPPPSTGGAGATAGANTSRPAPPAEPVADPAIVPPEPVDSDAISSASLDELNRTSPLKPVFFELDSA